MFSYLCHWFLAEKRELPWRESPTPYQVWVSEVMLQQTQVLVVIPYYKKWMKRFPTLKDLARAHEEEVIKLWEGLGYYSRARNLLAGARFVLKEFGGEIPNCPKKLSQIKGIGPYTQGAILSFAFKEKKAAVDGNVLRVMTRFLAIDEDISKAKTRQLIEEKTEELLPDTDPHIAMEALIELGATLCTKSRPKCEECPLRGECKAFKLKAVNRFPVKKQKVNYEKLFRVVPLFIKGGKCPVKKVEGKEVMSGLFEFPFEEMDEKSAKALIKKGEIEGTLTPFPPVKQSFTRFRVTLFPYMIKGEKPPALKGYQWVAIESLKELPFSSGHRKIADQLLTLSKESSHEHLAHGSL